MNTIAKKFEEKFAEKVADIEKQMELVRKHLPEIDNAEAIICQNGDARIGLPLDPPSNKKAIKRLEDAGFEVGEQSISDWGFGVYHSLKHKDYPACGMDIALFEHNEGSTCKIQPIGTKKVDRHVYEIVCNEGAMEIQP